MNQLPNLSLYSNFKPCDPQIFNALTHNSDILDSIVQLSVLGIVSDLPGSPSEGDRYILSTDGTLNIFLKSEWVTFQPQPGFWAFVEDQSSFYYYEGGWNIFEVSDSLKKDRSGLNILSNGSFEKENDLSDGWAITDGSINIVDTGMITSENKKALEISANSGATIFAQKDIPTEMLGMTFLFSGWVGPRSEPIQIDVNSGVENKTVTIPPSTKWELFRLYIFIDDTPTSLELRNTDAVTFQIDELFYGPVDEFLEMPNVTVNVVGSSNNEGDHITDLTTAFREQYPDLYARFGLGAMSAFRVFGTYLDNVDVLRYDYVHNGTTWIPYDALRIANDNDVSNSVISGSFKTAYREYDDDTAIALVGLKEGFTTIVAVKNIDSSAIDITLPPGVIARADVETTIEPNATNVFTFVRINGLTYVACVPEMVP